MNQYLLETARDRYTELAGAVSTTNLAGNQLDYAHAYLRYLAGHDKRRPDPMDWWPVAAPATRGALAAEARTTVRRLLEAATRRRVSAELDSWPPPARAGSWSVEPDQDYQGLPRWRVVHTNATGHQSTAIGNLDRDSLSQLWNAVTEVLSDTLEA